MNAKVRKPIDWGNIYINGIAVSRKFPSPFSTRALASGFASPCRTWGTRSHRNLMKVRLECLNARNVSWVVKKASSWVKVRCDELKAITVISRSSFLPEKPKRRISRGYCRDIGPRSPLPMYVLGLKLKLRTETV